MYDSAMFAVCKSILRVVTESLHPEEILQMLEEIYKKNVEYPRATTHDQDKESLKNFYTLVRKKELHK